MEGKKNNDDSKKNGGNNNDDDKSKTTALTQLERDILAKNQGRGGGQSRPGATSVGASSGGGSGARAGLTQLEQDVAAKQAARPTPSSSSPATSGLSQLEQDVAAKQSARGGGAISRPGAVSVATSNNGGSSGAPSAQLSQLEQDIVAKTQARGGVSAPASSPGATSSASPALSRLEQDIAAKTQARGGAQPVSRPGATSVTRGAGGALSQLEQDIASKSQSASGGGARAPAANAANQKLSQLEQDIAAKTQARGGNVQPISRPGAVASGTLSRLEQDIVAKTQASGGAAAASRPGAMPSGGGGRLTQLERDIVSKTQASAGRAAPPPNSNASLTQLERDVVAKTQARNGGGSVGTPMRSDADLKQAARGGAAPASRPGASSAGVGGALTRLEQDIVQKTSRAGAPAAAASASGGGGVSSSLTQLEQDLMAKTRASSGGAATANSHLKAPPASDSNLRRLEDDVRAKQGSMPGAPAMRPGAQAALSQLEQETMAKSRGQAMAQTSALDTLENDVMRKMEGGYNSNNIMPQQHTPAPAPPAYNNINESYDHRGYGDRPASLMPPPPSSGNFYAPGVTPDAVASQYNDQNSVHPEAPLYPGASVDLAGAESGGIEAFVAENVVDATGVAVIKSDEEEEVEVRRRQKKFMMKAALGVMLLLIAIILSVVLTRGSGEIVVTPAPTLAPTNSPTSSPTTLQVPLAAAELTAFSDITAMETKGSPQNRAVRWIAMEDTFVQENGLTPSDEKYVQRYILAVVYFALGGDDWTTCNRDDAVCSQKADVNSWLTNSDECTWNLLDCDDSNKLTIFDFGQQSVATPNEAPQLKGAVPPEIQHLTNMIRLVIPDMELTGPILDYVRNMSNLSKLSLPKNKFTGMLSETLVTDHPNLQTLDLSNNEFSGQLPTGFGSLQLLNSVDLANNGFTGPLPIGFGTAPFLQFLDLHLNQLTGTIPVQYYNGQLVQLNLGDNLIEGSIPSEIGAMISLKHLILGSSKMSGLLPPELFTLPNLQILHLHDSAFSGVLVEERFAQLSDTIVELWLQNNQFEGLIPATAIQNSSRLEHLLLKGNSLTGAITQAICDARGYEPGELEELQVDCSITCPTEECCDGHRDCP